MYLFYSPFHNFVHKSLVVAHESGVFDDVTFVPTYPFLNSKGEYVGGQYDLAALNPLAKVPYLALDNATVLYSSQVVIEYLDSLSAGARLYPAAGPARFDALRRLSLGDSVFEFAVQMVMEGWRDADERRADLYSWLLPKIERAYDAADAEAPAWQGFDIGHVGLLQGISFIDSWATGNEDVPGNVCIAWRSRWGALADWFDRTCERDSVQSHYGTAYEGDDSPEYFQAAVDKVLSARATST